MNITLDGFMSGPNCELDWHFQSWTKDMADSFYEQLRNADTILLGRVTYGAMAKYWPYKVTDLSFPREDLAFAGLMNDYTKLVFTKTLTSPGWSNSKLVNGNLEDEIVKLKRRPGKDMIIYGSGKVVATLIQSGLVDEYQLWVHPVLLGNGKPLFPVLKDNLKMKLCKTKTFSSGVVALYYESTNKI